MREGGWVGGGKEGRGGGVNFTSSKCYFFILLLFLLKIGVLFAGHLRAVIK